MLDPGCPGVRFAPHWPWGGPGGLPPHPLPPPAAGVPHPDVPAFNEFSPPPRRPKPFGIPHLKELILFSNFFGIIIQEHSRLGRITKQLLIKVQLPSSKKIT